MSNNITYVYMTVFPSLISRPVNYQWLCHDSPLQFTGRRHSIRDSPFGKQPDKDDWINSTSYINLTVSASISPTVIICFVTLRTYFDFPSPSLITTFPFEGASPPSKSVGSPSRYWYTNEPHPIFVIIKAFHRHHKQPTIDTQLAICSGRIHHWAQTMAATTNAPRSHSRAQWSPWKEQLVPTRTRTLRVAQDMRKTPRPMLRIPPTRTLSLIHPLLTLLRRPRAPVKLQPLAQAPP